MKNIFIALVLLIGFVATPVQAGVITPAVKPDYRPSYQGAAGPTGPDIDLYGCVPSSRQSPQASYPDGKIEWCRNSSGMDQAVRMYELEVAVQALQQESAQSRATAPISASSGVFSGGLEGRVTALESKFAGLQSFLMTVVDMLTQVLAKLR